MATMSSTAPSAGDGFLQGGATPSAGAMKSTQADTSTKIIRISGIGKCREDHENP